MATIPFYNIISLFNIFRARFEIPFFIRKFLKIPKKQIIPVNSTGRRTLTSLGKIGIMVSN
jgi:hypothetical protein